MACSTCGKRHRDKPCYKKIRVCFIDGKHDHMDRDCPNGKELHSDTIKDGMPKSSI